MCLGKLACITLLVMFPHLATLAAGPNSNNSHTRYKWKDAQNGVHFSDTLPIEAAQFGYDLVNDQGVVVKHVERTKTAEEIKVAQEQAQQVAEVKRRSEEQIRNDQQFLAAYPTEADLVRTQKAQLDMLDQNIHAAELDITSQESTLTERLAHAAELERNNRPVPDRLSQQIGSLRKIIEDQKAFIARKQKEKSDFVEKFSTELQRYRALVAKIKERQQQTH